MALRGLGYLGLAVTDLSPWRAFAAELLGLMPVAGPGPGAPDDPLRFRMDRRAWRLAVHRAPASGLAYAGWEAADRDALEAAAARLRAAGVAVETPGAEEHAARGVAGLRRFRDPFGQVHELFYGAAHDFDAEFVSPAGVTDFVTEHGMGHLLLTVPDCAAGEAFYTGALGLRVTDRMQMGGGKTVVFLRASPRHHSVAITDLLPQAGLHHFMLETRRLEDVGRGWDRVQNARVPIKMTLGQHANDPLVSFYVETPAGFDVEVGWNGMLIDEATWCVREFSGSGEIWGHRGMAMQEITSARQQAR